MSGPVRNLHAPRILTGDKAPLVWGERVHQTSEEVRVDKTPDPEFRRIERGEEQPFGRLT
jgi:hypothetical protein